MTPEQQQELERTSSQFHIAMIQLGAQATLDSLALWQDVPPLPSRGGSAATSAWLASAVAYAMRRHARARDLALAYYRYQSAVATGTTIALPGQENPPPYVSLPELKREFEQVLNPSATATGEQAPSKPKSTPTPKPPQDTLSNDEELAQIKAEEDAQFAEEQRILIEEIEDLDKKLAEDAQQAQDQLEELLKSLGPDNMNRKMELIDSESSQDVDKGRKDAHSSAGRRQSATVARTAMNGARGTLFTTGSADRKRIIGFARVSRTGTPCGWCAMLISRGFTPLSGLYRGAQGSSATVVFGDLDLYHDNCQCYAVPIFSKDQLTGDQFALNRTYADLWPIVTKGLGGKAAITAWRRFIRQEAKSQSAPEAAA